MKLSTIMLGFRVALIVDWQGDKVTFWYDPHMRTVQWAHDMAAIQKSGVVDLAEYGQLIAQVIVDWDVTDDTGAKVPFTLNVFMRLPLDLASAMMTVLAAELAQPVVQVALMPAEGMCQ